MAEEVTKEKWIADIVDILVAAGYFRARIATLSPFDKVVGGMAWCVTSTATSLDVDVVFQEEGTIGQKIKTGEQIVKALRRMKCPHELQSHQIQGLDYPNLHPIIKWLVKKVLEKRQETGDVLRLYSETQFEKNFPPLPSDAEALLYEDSQHNHMSNVHTRYTPQLIYKVPQQPKSKTELVENVLLEYGCMFRRIKADGTVSAGSEGQSDGGKSARGAAGGGGDGSGEGGSVMGRDARGGTATALKDRSKSFGALEALVTAEAEKEAEEAAEAEAQRMQEKMEQLGEVSRKGEAGNVSKSSVGKIVDLQSDAIRTAAEAYGEKTQQADEEGETTGERGSRHHERTVQQMKKRISALEESVKLLEASRDEAATTAAQVKEDVAKATKYNEKVVRETEKLSVAEASATEEASPEFTALMKMVRLNESLKVQEQEFKAQCKQQLSELNAKLAKLEEAQSNSEEAKKMQQIESMFDQENSKLTKVKNIQAKKNQEISQVMRSINDIPTRTELMQYERRFVELYKQVASKLEETRKYYATFNMLTDKSSHLSKEVSLLNNINQTFNTAMANQNTKGQFLESMDNIIGGVQKQLAKAEEKLENEGFMKEALSKKHKKLIDAQRRYFKKVKEFQEACNVNEDLQSEIEMRGR